MAKFPINALNVIIAILIVVMSSACSSPKGSENASGTPVRSGGSQSDQGTTSEATDSSVEEPPQSSLGRKIMPLKNEDGSPDISVVSSVRENLVMITFTVRGHQLVGTKVDTIGPSNIAVANEKADVLFSSWVETGLGNAYITPDSTQGFTVVVNDPAQVKSLTQSFRSAAVVLSLKKMRPAPSVYIDLGELCASNPDKFIDVDTNKKGCR